VNRVRVYFLAEHGNWEPYGVGMLSILGRVVRVDFEDAAAAPFELLVSAADCWRLESLSIIQVERQGSPDVAFSFQAPVGAEPCWREVSSLLNVADGTINGGPHGIFADSAKEERAGDGIIIDYEGRLGAEGASGAVFESDEPGAGDGGVMDVDVPPPSPKELPASGALAPVLPEPTYDNLKMVHSTMLLLAPSPSNLVGTIIMRDDYMRRLFTEVFREAEVRRDEQALRTLNEIAWLMLETLSRDLLYLFISDDLFESSMGVFEYYFRQGEGPSAARGGQAAERPKRYRFRRYLRRHVTFRQAVPIADPTLINHIHTMWRLNFLSDALGPLCSVESAQVSQWLLTIISEMESDVVSHVLRDNMLLSDTYSLIRNRLSAEDSALIHKGTPALQADLSPFYSDSEDSSDAEDQQARSVAAKIVASAPRSAQHDALAFLAEFIRWTRGLLPQARQNTYAVLQEGVDAAGIPSILLVLHSVLSDPLASFPELSLTFEILFNLVNSNPKIMRTFCSSPLMAHPSQPPPPPSLGSQEPSLAAAAGDATHLGSRRSASCIRPYERVNAPDMPASRLNHGALVSVPSAADGALLHCLVWRIVDDPDTRVQDLAMDILRILIDVTVSPPTVDISAFLDIVYARYLPWLCIPFTRMPAGVELPRPVDAMKNLDTMLQRFSPGLGDSALLPSKSLELNSFLRRNAPSVKQLIIAPLHALHDNLRPDELYGTETCSSKASKQCIAELILDLAARYPQQTKFLVQKHELYDSMPRLCLYSEKPLILMGLKLLRCFSSIKDGAITL
jgi:hypothetical protein